MKRLLIIVCIIFLALVFCVPVQAQPTIGVWKSKRGDFDAGSWSETLWGGGEGQQGNEIAAQSDCYRFGRAFLSKVKLIKATDDFNKYRTKYRGGDLKLRNDSSCPWYNDEDSILRFTAKSKKTVVKTTKYTADDTDDTMAFKLTYRGYLKDYPCFIADVKAKYNRGTPEVSGTGELPDDPLIISDDLSSATISITGPVAFDIKPGSCPNPVNVKSQGVLPTAVLGAGYLDVSRIDPDSILLNGVSPLRWAWEDVATPFAPCEDKIDEYDCNREGPDGYTDLTLKFDTQEIVDTLGDVNHRDNVVLNLTGNLEDGTLFTGEDVIVILNKGKK